MRHPVHLDKSFEHDLLLFILQWRADKTPALRTVFYDPAD